MSRSSISLLVYLVPVIALAELRVHVFDVGNALCTLTRTADGHFMVYDAGAQVLKEDHMCARRIHSEMPVGADIDVMILSHSDHDHVSGAGELLRRRTVNRVIRTGQPRATTAWCDMDYEVKVKLGGGTELDPQDRLAAIEECDETGVPVEVFENNSPPTPKAVDFNLVHYSIIPGEEVFRLGASSDAPTVTLLFGLDKTPDKWDDDFPSGSRPSRQRNAISIIAKVEYRDHSVLFTGDSVGLTSGTSAGNLEEPCIATERELIQSHNDGDIALRSNILIAPHHGSANGSCLEFISKVDPDQVIFAAGRGHRHPTYPTYLRYARAGVEDCDMLRTDRGDHEGRNEWRGPAHIDNRQRDDHSDDDILITLDSDGAFAEYMWKLGTVDDCPNW